jgi:type I restriction enzyme S subunit
MRINIGSIGMIDEVDEAGITSPDYVVFKGREGIIHSRWFYYWLRSPYGEQFIKSLARGAVRERMLFNRLKEGEIEIPSYEVQAKVAEKLREIRILREAVERQLEEINTLPSAILRRAFNP